MVEAIVREIELRASEFDHRTLATIYLGGGTPSLLSRDELETLFAAVYGAFSVDPTAEVTIEANPDDLNRDTVSQLSDTPINRLSIGVQSFDDRDLRLMNRAHTSREAFSALELARKSFEEISLDLIYGLPFSTPESWLSNVEKALLHDPVHLSCYALTVEPRTALHHQVSKGKVRLPDEEVVVRQFYDLIAFVSSRGFDHYEISNFARSGYYARHNTSYWKGVPYLGVGPSAHSFDGRARSWNISNNHLYLKAISQDLIQREKEVLSHDQRYNEYVMIGLRTKWGCQRSTIADFGDRYLEHFERTVADAIDQGMIVEVDDCFRLSTVGKAYADRLASDLFLV